MCHFLHEFHKGQSVNKIVKKNVAIKLWFISYFVISVIIYLVLQSSSFLNIYQTWIYIYFAYSSSFRVGSLCMHHVLFRYTSNSVFSVYKYVLTLFRFSCCFFLFYWNNVVRRHLFSSLFVFYIYSTVYGSSSHFWFRWMFCVILINKNVVMFYSYDIMSTLLHNIIKT